ncbi:hypothetical protein PMYN1_Chma750 (chromatophore) [Paulinella micropora]|uniref:PH domain-containing protein n=1 Tax=Paulinella micropora TaxID=1928728 RepID=A0A1L5YD05_9EUKA|nr:hypothetical protein PCKR_808 [Paulinella micropora]AQX45336.1 hypothetical protein PFK_808 [Paulinella micropora]BBL86555.1 hypothetical protein PMYN1_Chma750 [Paulinella micropora]
MLNNSQTFLTKDEIVFPLSPLIRITLLLLYLAIVLPLPIIAPTPLRVEVLALLLLGIVLIWSLVSEKISISRLTIVRGYPRWCLWFSSNKWEMNWNDIQGLIPVKSSQGGQVYYIKSRDNEAYLLPQRITRFDKFINHFKEMSGIEFVSVNKLTPAWTYELLATLSSLIIIAEMLTFFFIKVTFI